MFFKGILFSTTTPGGIPTYYTINTKLSMLKLNGIDTKLVTKWLGLTESTTAAVLHHPAVLDISFLADFSFKAKLNYLSAAHKTHLLKR